MLGKKKKGKDDHGAPEGDAKPAAEGEGAEGDAPKKKGLPLKMIIIAAAGLLVLGGGGGTAAFVLMKPKPHAEGEGAEHGAKGEHGKEKEKKKEKKGGHGKEGEKPAEGMGKTSEGPDGITYYAMPSILSDMQGSDGKPGQIKLDITFELSDEEIAETINENMPRLKDMLQTFLRELRPEDVQGSEGDFRLHQELMRRVNLIIQPAKINTLHLTNMVMS